jgi:hypothetical protein
MTAVIARKPRAAVGGVEGRFHVRRPGARWHMFPSRSAAEWRSVTCRV